MEHMDRLGWRNVPDAIKTHPAVATYASDRARVDETELLFADEQNRIRGEYDQQCQQWIDDVRSAQLSGKPMPDKPEPPGTLGAGDPTLWDKERFRIGKLEQEAFAKHAADLVDTIDTALVEPTAELTRLTKLLEHAQAEVDALQQARKVAEGAVARTEKATAREARLEAARRRG